MSWDDFDADEKPSWTVNGNTVIYTESKAILEASLDWAIDGIFNSIYDAADLTGWVGKADISVLANYKVTVGDGNYEELQRFDPNAADGEDKGKMVYVNSESFEVTGDYPKAKGCALFNSWFALTMGFGLVLFFMKRNIVKV